VLFLPLFFRYQNSLKEPEDTNPKEIKALVWAVHFGYTNFGRVNIPALADVIKEGKANVIGMVETDCTRTWIGNRDVVEYIGETLHFYTDFGPSTAQNTWGCGLISQFPIVRSDRIILPSPEGELACLIDADLRVNGTIVNVILSHFGNTEDELDRELQKEGLSTLLAAKKDQFSPTFFFGYLTTDVMSDHYLRIVGSGRLQDTTNSFDRYCLYILFRDLTLTSFYRIDKGEISDTEAQVALFKLKPNVPNDTPGTAETCRSFRNDHVACGAKGNCGICVFAPTRYCYEPTQRVGCLALNGTWLGPSFPTDPITNEEAAEEFYNVQFQQQSSDLAPMSYYPPTDSYVWTLNNFQAIWDQYTKYNSAVFKAEKVYWRLALKNMRGPLSPVNQRNLWIGVELMGNFKRTVKTTVDISVVNHYDPSKTVTIKSPNVFTPETEALGTNVITVGTLWEGFISAKGFIKIEVKFRDVHVQLE